MIYKQELRRWPNWSRPLQSDERNLVPIAHRCHERHHQRVQPLLLGMLPDSVFEFAEEHMGPGAAYEYLRRRYDGVDARLLALLEAA